MLDSLTSQKLEWLKEGSLDLLVETYSNAVRTVQIRGFTENEQIIADHLTTSDRSLTAMSHPISGLPLYLTVRTAETSVSRGECYVKVSLRLEGVVVALLMSGYVTDAGAQAFPNGKIESSVEGPGLLRSITGTDPAAGVEISETVPTGARWKPHSIRVNLVADATVVTRFPILTIDDGANIYFNSGRGAQATASQNIFISFADVGAEDITVISAGNQLLPSDLMLPAGHRIKTVTAGLVAGDDWAAPQMLIEEWIEP